MPMKEQQRTVYKTMQGKEVDMNKLYMQNETAIAVGNIRVNARGDELGPGGTIVKKREEVLRDSGIPDENVVRREKLVSTPTVEQKQTRKKQVDPQEGIE